MRRFAFVPLMAALLLSGCSDWIVDTFDYGVIEVDAARRSGEPIADVKLLIFTSGRRMAWGNTDETGRHRFEFVIPGNWGVRAIAPQGFVWPGILTGEPVRNVVTGVSMEEGGREQVSFTLLKVGPGSVEVVVSEPDGTPVPGADVELFGISRELQATAITGPEGRALFEPVGIGHYGVRLLAPTGYETPDGAQVEERDGLLVDADFRATVSFELRRTS